MPNPATNSGIRDNHRRGVVADFLKAKIHSGSRLSVVSAYFTIYAYDALREHLDQIDHLDFLFGEPRFIASLDPAKTDKKTFKIEDEGLQLDRTFRVMTWTPGPRIREFPLVFDENAFSLAQRELKPGGWQLESSTGLRLLERLRAAGKPLGEYVNGRFYYGIKTGLNEAFVVDRTTRDRLIREHKSSADILKPFLRGRDVKRWQTEFAEQYLIKIESSENKDHP